MQANAIYPAVFYYEENGFTIIFPDFDSGTDGQDLADAMYNAQELLDSLVAYYLDEDKTLPKPSSSDNLPVDPDFEGYKYFTTLFTTNPLRFSERS